MPSKLLMKAGRTHSSGSDVGFNPDPPTSPLFKIANELGSNLRHPTATDPQANLSVSGSGPYFFPKCPSPATKAEGGSLQVEQRDLFLPKRGLSFFFV